MGQGEIRSLGASPASINAWRPFWLLPVHRDRVMRVWLNGHEIYTRTRRGSSQDFLSLALRVPDESSAAPYSDPGPPVCAEADSCRPICAISMS